jgi:hypothetical protein
MCVACAPRAAVDNPQPAEIPLKKPLRTVLTSGATSPQSLGMNDDQRQLGLWFVSMGIYKP